MGLKSDLESEVSNFFSGNYAISDTKSVPEVSDIEFGKKGKRIEAAMLFVDLRRSTEIVDGFRRETAAKMYKSFLFGVIKIVRENNGHVRSFNGDGVLAVFVGDLKRTNAVKCALQLVWFCSKVLKPKLESYFENNNQLKGFNFDFGVGVDVGSVLVVRGGIRGSNNNDLVWVGNATNYAVKLSDLSKDGYHVYISEDVYKKMDDNSKYGGEQKINMWEARVWRDMDDISIYRSNWSWRVVD